VNAVLFKTGSTISKLLSIPKSILEKVKFSEVISYQFSKVYRKKISETLHMTLRRAHVNSKFVWNYLIAIGTGRLKLNESKYYSTTLMKEQSLSVSIPTILSDL